MRKRGKHRRKNTCLELTFYQLLLQLDPVEREWISEELEQPFRRHWFIVDEHGVRRLE
jgi:hypothetical protein